MTTDLLEAERKIFGREIDGVIAWVLAGAHVAARLHADGLRDGAPPEMLEAFQLSVDQLCKFMEILRGLETPTTDELPLFQEFGKVLRELRDREPDEPTEAIPLEPIKH